jgi:two-component system LytT family sensor kinase
LKKLSLYWKCQLIGWTTFMLVVYMFNTLIYTEEAVSFIPFAISIFFFGLISSHLMKLVVKKFRVFRKKFTLQVITLMVISAVFSLVGTFAWMMIMIQAGFWKIDIVKYGDWQSAFMRGYYFNLFPVLLTLSGWLLIYFLFNYVRKVRREERLRVGYKLQMAELEAKALRAQMNPHFIFNCLNSIKSLIQEDQKGKSVTYLTTFSKLIRTLFNNADKKEISLHDEIATGSATI